MIVKAAVTKDKKKCQEQEVLEIVNFDNEGLSTEFKQLRSPSFVFGYSVLGCIHRIDVYKEVNLCLNS